MKVKKGILAAIGMAKRLGISKPESTIKSPREAALEQDPRRGTFVYIDESGTEQRWFGVGAVVFGPQVSMMDDLNLNKHIRNIKTSAGIRLRGDVGWKKVPGKPGRYFDFYQRCVDGFFRHPNLRFFGLLVDTHLYPLDSRIHFHGSRSIGIDAFTLRLLRDHVLPRYRDAEHIRIRFDRRRRPARTTVAAITVPLRRAQTGDAQITGASITGGRHPLVHVADLILGSLTSSLNSKATQAGKRMLTERLRTHLAHDPTEGTVGRFGKFNLKYFEAHDSEL